MSNNNSNGRTVCMFENIVKLAGYRTVYDGQTAVRPDAQFVVPPEERRFFTRHLRKFAHGKFEKSWVVLRYDLRSELCIECFVTEKQPGLPKQTQMVNVTESAQVVNDATAEESAARLALAKQP